MGGELLELWANHTGRLMDKWAHYLPIYERHFRRFRDTHVRVLEIGVSHGGSLEMWKAWFGWQSEITGLDIDERCFEYAHVPTGIWVHIGDQGNAGYMAAFAKSCGPWDIIIDDGSHKIDDQITSFSALWPHVNPGGVYLVEDDHAGDFGRFTLKNHDLMSKTLAFYLWVVVVEKVGYEFTRIVTGTPSRPLNAAELEAYGAIDAKYLHTDP